MSPPHVSLIVNPSKQILFIPKPKSYAEQYFTIEALEDGLTISLSMNTCEYRIDNGSWNLLSADTNTPSINKGQTLSFRGNLISNSGKSLYAVDPDMIFGIGTFTISKKCNLKGNIMSMLYGDDFIDKNDLSGKDYAFYKLFSGCSTIVDASEFILPATTLANCCYFYMFTSCTSLTTAPELPATTLASGCYVHMFTSCTSLTAAPQLLATTLENNCYKYMFYLCSNLNYIKMLATNISASGCLDNWVNGVASAGTFIKDPNMTALPSGKSGIPSGWVVGPVPETPDDLPTITPNN